MDRFTADFTRQWTAALPMVSAFVGSMVFDPSDREDVLQDCAMAAVTSFDRFDSSRPFNRMGHRHCPKPDPSLSEEKIGRPTDSRRQGAGPTGQRFFACPKRSGTTTRSTRNLSLGPQTPGPPKSVSFVMFGISNPQRSGNSLGFLPTPYPKPSNESVRSFVTA